MGVRLRSLRLVAVTAVTGLAAGGCGEPDRGMDTSTTPRPPASVASSVVTSAPVRDADPYCPTTAPAVSDDAAAERLAAAFAGWPVPPVAVVDGDLPGIALACFDGRQVLVERTWEDAVVIVAHEYCHALAHGAGAPVPPGFPVPDPPPGRPDLQDPTTWSREIWAVTCATAATGERDWTFGNIVDLVSPSMLSWAAAWLAAGPPDGFDPSWD